ncbi:MAG: murein biosynthesis integral membrane protein MurJ [Eggerthellaceae bacterium]|nr:murein biosynthesis integral membrane protein MurJ [Eggerthellaceae bacterium]
MPDKLKRARHTHGAYARIENSPAKQAAEAAPTPTAAVSSADATDKPRGRHATSHAAPRHAGVDRTVPALYAPGETGLIPVVGSHAGIDRTAVDPFEPKPEASAVNRKPAADASAPSSTPAERTPEVGASAALISICTIISRITGFARTWAMAFALGATFVSSSYQVANNLPNMLYELVMGGMLTTAFLPVYLSVKKKLGKQMSEEYASNLLTIVVAGLGVVSVLCMIFPAQVIYTQTFYSDQQEMDLAVFLFRFFAIQVVFYGASSIISGLLNANRDYLWGAIAPVLNNVIVIATFLAYAFVAPTNQELAFYIIAIGNPLGVFVQMAIQLPGLARNGIRLRPHINLHDPALRETLSLGLPALFVTICSFVTVSVTNAASYCFADNGPSVIAYSRLWFTFPYSFLAVPVATAMFTELSDMQADGNRPGVVRGIVNGSNQIFFLMIPFALYLVVFSVPLVTLYHMGAFTADSIGQIASYLAVLAVALPFYGVNSYLQMVFSSIRKMKACSVVMFVASAAQVGIIGAAAWGVQNGIPVSIESIACGTIASYLISDVLMFLYLRRVYGRMGLGSTVLACLRGLALGAAGAVAGGGALFLLETLVAPLSGSIAQAFAYVVAGGVVALVVTFAPAVKLQLPEAAFVTGIVEKVARKLRR